MKRAAFGLGTGLLLLAGCAGGGGPAPDLPPPPVARAPSSSAPPARPAAPLPAARGWRPARVIANAALLPTREVIVGPGDTLIAVAGRTDTTPAVLAAANGLVPPYTLAPGARLTIPAGRWHIVKRGETLSAIARAYRAVLAPVARVNALKPPYALEIGDRVLIPAAPPRPAARPPAPPKAPPATVEGRAQAFNLDIDTLLRGEPQARPTRRTGPSTPPPLRGPPPRSGEDRSSPERGGGPPAPRGVEGSALPEATPAIRLDWPLAGRILSAFGPKVGGRFNDGINIAAIAGASVRAAADGTVAYAGTGVAAFGGLVLIRHEGGWLTAYAHCEALLVARGDTVRRGQPIARAGATGEVDQPQLHFEVRRGRTPVDPLRSLPAR